MRKMLRVKGSRGFKLTAFKEVYKLKTLAITVESEIKITGELLYLISKQNNNYDTTDN